MEVVGRSIGNDDGEVEGVSRPDDGRPDGLMKATSSKRFCCSERLARLSMNTNRFIVGKSAGISGRSTSECHRASCW
jgi:hypothetical protein